MKSSLSIWQYVADVKLTVKILSIFVAFLENMNFKFIFGLQNSKPLQFDCPILQLPYSREFYCALLIERSIFCQNVTVPKDRKSPSQAICKNLYVLQTRRVRTHNFMVIHITYKGMLFFCQRVYVPTLMWILWHLNDLVYRF